MGFVFSGLGFRMPGLSVSLKRTTMEILIPRFLGPKKSVSMNQGLASGSIVEARKLQHQYPHALKLEFRGS